MVREQQEYIKEVDEKICSLETVDGKGVRVLNSGPDGPAIVPTTQELMAYIQNAESMKKIESTQQDCLQRAEEKVAISKQTYSLVDDICKRLDNDLVEMENILQVGAVPIIIFLIFVPMCLCSPVHLLRRRENIRLPELGPPCPMISRQFSPRALLTGFLQK